ncbi:nitroreductase [Campylobacter iguaniorum]|uniref:Nitroreductase n=1 Tax=Campylobacter iguaniorum TaxID=1244531 RepID=A0A076FI16_9BACT|nr:nitroreductase family protein [Campylobacter iguaniorum]AII15449.1 nitroreductase [Campylobacter iguaniorum]
MEFYEVLENRRTVRDFSDKEVPDEVLSKILGAGLKAPSNDHLRQLEFVVVRGYENIIKILAPIEGNIASFTKSNVSDLAEVMDKDEYAMFVDAMPKQQRMLMQSNCLVLPFFRQIGSPLLKPKNLSSLNYFASAWASIENIMLGATAEGLACALHIPIMDESEHVKQVVGAPADYELACFLAIGYKSDKAPNLKQKEIKIADKIHKNKW